MDTQTLLIGLLVMGALINPLIIAVLVLSHIGRIGNALSHDLGLVHVLVNSQKTALETALQAALIKVSALERVCVEHNAAVTKIAALELVIRTHGEALQRVVELERTVVMLRLALRATERVEVPALEATEAAPG